MKNNHISASEVAEFVYCQRAWWYRIRGFESSQQAVMELGAEQHQQLGRQVQWIARVKRLAWQLIVAGAVLLLILVILRLLSGMA
ncbi:MAG: hypothetical protein HZC41_08515 [Chloroflexi bacterium]|nr:hypothetical protein [Chloroflexota bacterium]